MRCLALLIAMILLVGCAGQTEQPVESEECKVLDGTWKGVIKDSGTLQVTRFVDGQNVVTQNPFTAQYDFEMTIACERDWEYNITHVKASHPLFKCEQGCKPQVGDAARGLFTWFFFDENDKGYLQVVFPNGGVFSFPLTDDADDKGVYISGDKLAINIPGKYEWETIGSLVTPDNIYFVETHNCEQFGGDGFCEVISIDKNTITLTKI